MLFLEAGRIIVDNADMYRFVDDETEQQHGDSLAHGECSLAMRGLYFENGEHKVLLDPGPGSWIGGFFPGYRFSSILDAGDILESNAINASEVTDIFLTHLHFDHCAGIFRQEGDLLVPYFPGAVVHVSGEQADVVENPSPLEKDSFLPGFIRLIRKFYELSLCDREHLPVFLDDVIFTDGHTRGMMIPVFSSGRKKYIYASDLVPTMLNMEMPLVSGYDVDPELLYHEKKSFFKNYGNRGYHLIFFHEGDTGQREIAFEP